MNTTREIEDYINHTLKRLNSNSVHIYTGGKLTKQHIKELSKFKITKQPLGYYKFERIT